MVQRICPSCSVVSETEKGFCPECGTRYDRSTTASTSSGDGGSFATAGLACGIVAFLFFPIVLGPLGIVLGAIAWNKGHPRGQTATIVSIVGLIVGMMLGAVMWS